MSVNALSGHGALIAYEDPSSPGNYITVAELGDITPPGLMRNEFDATTQQEDIDSYVLGVLRRQPVTVKMNFIPSDSSHDHLTGIASLIIANTMTGWRFTFPGNWVWLASGQVQNFVPHAPVDGKFEADLTIRFSGKFSINGTVIG